jgi:hypothetical protein
LESFWKSPFEKGVFRGILRAAIKRNFWQTL